MTRVLVGLETCDRAEYLQRRLKCLASWANELPDGYDMVVGSGMNLGVDDSYEKLGLKTQALCAIGLREGYDWLLVCDDDVFVRTDRLTTPDDYMPTVYDMARRDEGLRAQTGDYFGKISGPSGDKPHRYCYGGCYWLSRRAMRIVADAVLDDSVEDRWVGGVLLAAGILPVELAGYEIAPCLCGKCKPVQLTKDWIVAVDLNWPGQFEAVAEMAKQNSLDSGKSSE